MREIEGRAAGGRFFEPGDDISLEDLDVCIAAARVGEICSHADEALSNVLIYVGTWLDTDIPMEDITLSE